MIAPAELYRTPNRLAADYRRFAVADRLLLTGHSHQAWPDAAHAAQLAAFDDAAELVDAKWERAFEQAERARAGFARLLDDEDGAIALGASTHDLLIRLLSALPLVRRPRLVTTDGEFHTIRRQLDRLAEEGVEVVRVAATPTADVAARLEREIDDRTAAVLVSAVFFGNGRITGDLSGLAGTCARHGTELVVDAYHALNVVPFGLRSRGLERAFVLGGGYKYCQLGEGNCFMRVPPGCELRPVVTGWFAEFDALAAAADPGTVAYGNGAARFAGSTYDPTSHYRAAAVFEFFADRGLTPELLREVSQHQIGLLARRFDALDADPAVVDRDRRAPLTEIAGFLVLDSPRAGEICDALRARGVMTDHRGTALRLGPAPYLSDVQLEEAIGILGEVIAQGGSRA